MLRVVESSEIDLNFKFEVAKTREGKTVLGCIQCGVCSSSCPFSEELDVKPHKVVRMVILGLRKEVLSCKEIWTCAMCYMCAERCPHGVELGNVMMALANVAARERALPSGLGETGRVLLKEGRVPEIGRMRVRERERIGLPPVLTPNIGQIKRLLEETGVSELVVEEGGK